MSLPVVYRRKLACFRVLAVIEGRLLVRTSKWIETISTFGCPAKRDAFMDSTILSRPAGFFTMERASELCVLACPAQLSHTLACFPGVFHLRPILSGCVCSAPHRPSPPQLPNAVSRPQILSGGGCPGSPHLQQDGHPARWPGLPGLVLIFLHPQSPSFLGGSPCLRGDTASPEGAGEAAALPLQEAGALPPGLGQGGPSAEVCLAGSVPEAPSWEPGRQDSRWRCG